MRGYALPIVLALLLAAPMLWRLDGDVNELPRPAIRVVFESLPPDFDPKAIPADSEVDFGFVPLLPAAGTLDSPPLEGVSLVVLPLPEAGD